jgi:hypothetical protein
VAELCVSVFASACIVVSLGSVSATPTCVHALGSPVHVNVGSTWQFAVQPSRFAVFVSSHFSAPRMNPSPQTVTHELGMPVHDQPVSVWHVEEQPSPFVVLLPP